MISKEMECEKMSYTFDVSDSFGVNDLFITRKDI